MLVAQPASLSVYRGQSRTGQGEGPGKTVLHGEQYMRVDPPLFHPDLLDAIRPWMTLDSDPADHQRLNDQLEGWSLFPAGEYLFVVRLVSAGVYDRRAAYFAHGRAWKRDALTFGFDAGLHLGRSDAFDSPWREERPAAASFEDVPAVVRIEQIAGESQTAARFLGHLMQALTESYQLIIAAPVADFASRGALHALIGMSRAALPAALQRGCRIRVYSRFPELFLRHLGANLVVVPEEAASDALTARPTATLIDRQGRKISGKEVGERMLSYATAVIERAIAIPEGLPFFSARMRDGFGGDARAVQITYNLAFAFAGSDERKTEVLRRYLPRAAEKLGPGLPWSDLIGREEWSGFPREALLDELLTDPGTLSEGRRELLRAAENGASHLGIRVDDRLNAWWDARDRGKLMRLFELLAHEPPLVSDRAVAERTVEIPLEELSRAGSPAGVIEAEAKHGQLAGRAHESAALARAASDAGVFTILSRAVANDRFDPTWARTYIQTASRDDLIEAARRWFGETSFFREAWADVPLMLLGRLRSLEPPPASLAAAVTSAGTVRSPATDLEIHLGLADVLTRIDQAAGRDTENTLVTALWRALPDLGEAGREAVERIAFDPSWRCIRLARVDLQTLLMLAAGFWKEESLSQVYEELDTRMLVDVETTTSALARGGWWYFWRLRSSLKPKHTSDSAILRRSALAWLACPVWTDGGGAEVALETWDAVLADLPRTLERHELARLCADGARRWPWIPPFEEVQFAELIDRVGDLGGLAELAEVVSAERWPTPNGKPIAEYVLSESRLTEAFPPNALAWLMDDRQGGERPVLTLDESARLYSNAGHRSQQALAARAESVAKTLDSDPRTALRVASDPNLWSDGRFLMRVAEWMNEKGSIAAITFDVLRTIDDHVNGEPAAPLRTPSAVLVRELVEAGLHHAASLLHREWSSDAHKETLADEVIAALLTGAFDHRCWQQLASRIEAERAGGGRHPLGILAERIRAKALSPKQRKTLAASGWRTFQAAGRGNPPLLSALVSETAIARVLEFAAAMLPSGGLGTAALQLVFALTNLAFRTDVQWWRNLVKAMRAWKRHGAVPSADDREDAAFALLFSALDEKEQDALRRALRNERHWSIPFEFGESML